MESNKKTEVQFIDHLLFDGHTALFFRQQQCFLYNMGGLFQIWYVDSEHASDPVAFLNAAYASDDGAEGSTIAYTTYDEAIKQIFS